MAELEAVAPMRIRRKERFVFIENDMDFLLHRLPEERESVHDHDDETPFARMLPPRCRGFPAPLPSGADRGRLYPQVRSACRELFE